MSQCNWMKLCAYNEEQKSTFHRVAKQRLQQLARILEFNKECYDIRSNKGGIAVSGEVTLHHNHVYVQVAQSCAGPDHSIMIRTCKGRKDYTGGRNYFVPISYMDNLPRLADRVRAIMETGENR